MTQMYQQPPAVQPPKNGMGTAALVLGIIGILLAWIPIIGFLGFILGTLAIILGGIAVFKAHKGTANNKVVSYFGLGLGVAAFVISFAVFGAFANSLDKQLPAAGPPSAGAESTHGNAPADENKVARKAFGESHTWSGGEQIAISQPEEFTPDNSFMAAPDGKRLVSMDVTITNNSSDEYNVMGASFTAQHDGRVAQQSMAGDMLPNVQLPPGGKTTFTLVYEVGASPGELQLSVQPNAFAQNTVYFSGTF